MRRLSLPPHFGALYVCPAEDTESAQSAAAHRMLSEALPLYTEERRITLSDPPTLLCTDMGKPYFSDLPDVRFNLTHCRGLAGCLFSPWECGVDAEGIRPVRERVVRRVFSAQEQEMLRHAAAPDLLFTRLWTLKEAYVKAIGVGISYPMREVSFSFGADGEIVCSKTEAGFWQTTEAASYVISVCILNEEHSS